MRRNEDGVPEEEENFEEAITHLNTSLVKTQVIGCDRVDV